MVRPLRRSLWLLAPMELAAGAAAVAVLVAYQALLQRCRLGHGLRRPELRGPPARTAPPERRDRPAVPSRRRPVGCRPRAGGSRLPLEEPARRSVAALVLAVCWTVPVAAVLLLGRASAWLVPWRSSCSRLASPREQAVLAPRGVARFLTRPQARGSRCSSSHSCPRARDVPIARAPSPSGRRETRLKRNWHPGCQPARSAAGPAAEVAQPDRRDSGACRTHCRRASGRSGRPPAADSAFLVWAQTRPGGLRLASTSSCTERRHLVSRYRAHLPDTPRTPRSGRSDGCGWEFFGRGLRSAPSSGRLLHAAATSAWATGAQRSRGRSSCT